MSYTSTPRPRPDSPEALARALALAMGADNALDSREWQVLQDIDAYAQIGIPAERFQLLAREALHHLQGRFTDKPWLSLEDQSVLDEALEAITRPELRLLLCRLVARLITADGSVSDAERLVYEHMLMRYRITRQDVTVALRLSSRAPAASSNLEPALQAVPPVHPMPSVTRWH